MSARPNTVRDGAGATHTVRETARGMDGRRWRPGSSRAFCAEIRFCGGIAPNTVPPRDGAAVVSVVGWGPVVEAKTTTARNRTVEIGAHLPLIPFSGTPSLAELRRYAATASRLGYRWLSANDHLVFRRPWLDGPTALAAVLDASGDLGLATTIWVSVALRTGRDGGRHGRDGAGGSRPGGGGRLRHLAPSRAFNTRRPRGGAGHLRSRRRTTESPATRRSVLTPGHVRSGGRRTRPRPPRIHARGHVGTPWRGARTAREPPDEGDRAPRRGMEDDGIEPTTSALQRRRSPS